MTAETAMTMSVSLSVSSRVGQVTLRSSATVSATTRRLNRLRAASGLNLRGTPWLLTIAAYLTSRCNVWVLHLGQYFFSSIRCGSLRRLLLVLYVRSLQSGQARVARIRLSPLRAILGRAYATTCVITPEPTVRPPSRTAKRSCSVSATGMISLIFISMLSPGMTISTPSGSSISPVTSVVRI
jgi:hypothetical protein